MNQFVFEPTRPVVDTKQGKLRGVTYGDVNIFMGVQYAHAKRFQMPTMVEPWEGVKNAYHHGPIAMQVLAPNPFAYYRGLHMLEKQSEDCQNLNIWAPKTLNGEKKPVFVWIHGGGYFAGNAFEEISFDGFNFAHYGDAIFVSINHRLNIFAHLNLEEYGEQYKNSGNAGIADLVVAMKWIHENIAAFGGDPENVTICGHSGGGGKVQCLLQLEEAAPTFQRAICLSGAMGNSGPMSNSIEKSRATAKAMMDYLGITKENIDEVNNVPFEKLIEACKAVSNPFSWSPVPNDWFPGYPGEMEVMPFSKDKPVIYGSTLGEFARVNLTAEDKEAMTEEDKVAYLRNQYGEGADELIKLFKAAYPDHDTIDLAYFDSNVRAGAMRAAKAHVRSGNKNTYLLLAAYNVPEDGSIPIWHGGEVAYIFMNEDKVLVLNDAVYGQKYSQILSTLVLNFVKYGDPNNKYLPKWLPLTEEENNTMVIDKTCRNVSHFDDELVVLHDKVCPKFVLKLETK